VVPLPAQLGRALALPVYPVESFQHRYQLIVPQLERCGGEEQHTFEHAAERTRNDLVRVINSFGCVEQRGETRAGVLDVMCFVQHEQRQRQVELREAVLP